MRSCRSLAVNFPAERLGGLVVAVHEAQQGPGQLPEAVEVVRGDDFLLDDGEEDLDLVQPGRVQRGVDHDRVRVRFGEPFDGGLAAVV